MNFGRIGGKAAAAPTRPAATLRLSYATIGGAARTTTSIDLCAPFSASGQKKTAHDGLLSPAFTCEHPDRVDFGKESACIRVYKKDKCESPKKVLVCLSTTEA